MASIGLSDLVGITNALLEWGLKGNGSSDDASAFNNLMSAAASGSAGHGGTVVLPPTPAGYKLGSNVTVPTGVTLIILQGVTLSGAGTIVVSGTGTILDFRAGFTVTGSLTTSSGLVISAPGVLTVAGLATLSGGASVAGAVALTGATLGFFNTAPVAKPTVAGSRAGNAALASLLINLSNLGLLTDSSTA